MDMYAVKCKKNTDTEKNTIRMGQTKNERFIKKEHVLYVVKKKLILLERMNNYQKHWILQKYYQRIP